MISYITIGTIHLNRNYTLDKFMFKPYFKGLFELENKIFHVSFDDLNQNNSDIKTSLDSMLQYVDFNVTKYTDNECRHLIFEKYHQFFITFLELPIGKIRNNFCKYLMIYHYGGIYTNKDRIFQMDPARWASDGAKIRIQPKKIQIFVSVEPIVPDSHIDNGLGHQYSISPMSFSANKNHPILLNCLQSIHDELSRNKTLFQDHAKIKEFEGNSLLTKMVQQYLGVLVQNLTIFESVPMIIKDVYIARPSAFNCGINMYDRIKHPCDYHTISTQIQPFRLQNRVFHMSVKELDQNDEFTQKTVESTSKFRDFTLTRFSDQECADVLAKSYSKFSDTFANLPFGVMKSDFCRYLMIYHYGGVYIDSDVVVQRHPDEWVPFDIEKRVKPEMINVFVGVEAFLPVHYKESRFYHPYQISQWSFAAQKHHPIFLNCIQDIDNLFKKERNKFNDIHNIIELTGPGAMTRAVHDYIRPFIHDISVLATTPMIIKDVYIGPPHALNCGPNWYENIQYHCNEYTVSHHLYGGRWKGGLKK